MTVKELVEKLSKLDQNKSVVIGATNCCGDVATAADNIEVHENSISVYIFAEDE